MRVSFTPSTERDCQPPCEWCSVYRRLPAGRDGSLHVRSSWHGYSGWGEGEHSFVIITPHIDCCQQCFGNFVLNQGFVIPGRLTCTSWPSLRQENGFTSTQRWPTAVAVCLLLSQRTNVLESESTRSKWLSGTTAAREKKTTSPGLCFSLFSYSVFILQRRPHICRQLPDSYSKRHRVCGLQHRRVVCCQRVDHGQWSQSAGRSCGCCQVTRCCSASHVFSGLKRESLPDWSIFASSIVFFLFWSPVPLSLQALAGFRLFNHLCDRTTWHAEAAGGGLVVSAQLPSWYCLLLRRSGPRPAETQGQLPQSPDRGQTGRTGGLRVFFFF